MLIHAIAHGGCRDTVRESALEADCGRKIPYRTGDSNPHQYCAWLFSPTVCQVSLLLHSLKYQLSVIRLFAKCIDTQEMSKIGILKSLSDFI